MSAKGGRLLRFFRAMAIAVALSALFTFGLAAYWRAIDGGAMTVHGWIAMRLGVVGTMGLGWLLMALLFKSDREGWDDRVDNHLDPGRNDPY